MRFIFTCGGTAGHINPAISIAGCLKEKLPDAEILFVGSGRQLENRLIPQAGFKITNIKVSGFERSFKPRAIAENIAAVFQLGMADIQMRRIIKEFRPDAAIGTGGYVCYPVLKSIAAKGIPTVIHESNAIPGLTTKMLAKIVDRIYVAFPNVQNYYSTPEKVEMTGTPIRSDFLKITKAEARRKLGLDDKPLVISFWGSLGADRMNEATATLISRNSRERRFHHIHATGSDSEGTETLKKMLADLGVKDDNIPCTELRTYIDDMPTVMNAADVVLCRAGASTLSELQIMAKPSVLVPSPYVVNDHQTQNAKQLEEMGGAVVMRESECVGESLYETITDLLDDDNKLEKMSESLKSMAIPDAAERISDYLISMAKE